MVIIVAGWLFFAPAADEALEGTRSGEDGGVSELSELREVGDADSRSGTDQLKELFLQGEDLRCTFTQTSGTMENSGTAYMSAGSFRVDAITVDDGEQFTSNMIYDGETVYAWSASEEGEFAFMFSIPPEELLEQDELTAPDGSSVPLSEEVNYDCEAWDADAARFTPPQDLEFMDVASMMNAAMERIGS